MPVACRGKPYKDLTGKKIGKLQVLTYYLDLHTKDPHKRYVWLCICDCGAEVCKPSSSLLNNKLLHSCEACYAKGQAAYARLRHIFGET